MARERGEVYQGGAKGVPKVTQKVEPLGGCRLVRRGWLIWPNNNSSQRPKRT